MTKEVKSMKKRMISISLCMLMITAAFVGTAVGADDWPSARHDPANTAFSALPLESNSIRWVIEGINPDGASPVVAGYFVYAYVSTPSDMIKRFYAHNGVEDTEWSIAVPGYVEITVESGKIY